MERQKNKTVQMESAIAAQNEIKGMYRSLYDANPGLEQFQRIKKTLLWGIIGLVAVQKVITIFAMPITQLPVVLFGLFIGLAVPGIVVLAIYRGPFKFSLWLYLWAALLLWDIVANGLPMLSSGMLLSPLFYAMMALQMCYCLYVFAIALWLTVPSKNRSYAEAINEVYKESIQKMKEASKKE